MLLIVIFDGSVYLDAVIPVQGESTRLTLLLSNNQPYQIITSGPIPLQQTPTEILTEPLYRRHVDT